MLVQGGNYTVEGRSGRLAHLCRWAMFVLKTVSERMLFILRRRFLILGPDIYLHLANLHSSQSDLGGTVRRPKPYTERGRSYSHTASYHPRVPLGVIILVDTQGITSNGQCPLQGSKYQQSILRILTPTGRPLSSQLMVW